MTPIPPAPAGIRFSSGPATGTAALGSMTIFIVSQTRRMAARMASSETVTMSVTWWAMIGNVCSPWGVSAYIAMPKIAAKSKVAAVERYGGNIVWVESKERIPTSEEYDATAAAIQERTGANPVHPYDDLRTIAGQATCALELLEDVPDLDLLLAPVGGGGLLSGTCLAAAARAPRPKVIGCEPEMADDAQRSFQQGVIVPQTDPQTIADGLRTSLSPAASETAAT